MGNQFHYMFVCVATVCFVHSQGKYLEMWETSNLLLQFHMYDTRNVVTFTDSVILRDPILKRKYQGYSLFISPTT